MQTSATPTARRDAADGGGQTAPCAGAGPRPEWSRWWSCGVLLAGGVVVGGTSGEGEEHLVQPGLAEREVGDRHTGAGQLRQRVGGAFGVGDLGRDCRRIG